MNILLKVVAAICFLMMIGFGYQGWNMVKTTQPTPSDMRMQMPQGIEGKAVYGNLDLSGYENMRISQSMLEFTELCGTAVIIVDSHDKYQGVRAWCSTESLWHHIQIPLQMPVNIGIYTWGGPKIRADGVYYYASNPGFQGIIISLIMAMLGSIALRYSGPVVRPKTA